MADHGLPCYSWCIVIDGHPFSDSGHQILQRTPRYKSRAVENPWFYVLAFARHLQVISLFPYVMVDIFISSFQSPKRTVTFVFLYVTESSTQNEVTQVYQINRDKSPSRMHPSCFGYYPKLIAITWHSGAPVDFHPFAIDLIKSKDICWLDFTTQFAFLAP